MIKLNINDPAFTVGARIGDSVPFNNVLMGIKDRDGAIVALHAVKNIAFRMEFMSNIRTIGVNGTFYAIK